MIGFIDTFITVTRNHNQLYPLHKSLGHAPFSFLFSMYFDQQAKVKSHIATDGQSISKSWCRADVGLMTRYLLLFDSYGLVVFVGRPV
jgi:hypothetical protein